jgi:transcriptional regulator GlxA family with amidase domain
VAKYFPDIPQQRQLDVQAPTAALAEYLGVSAMGRQRLFHQATDRAPGRALLRMKMRGSSRPLSRPGSTVKEAALTLGYPASGRLHPRLHQIPHPHRAGRRHS